MPPFVEKLKNGILRFRYYILGGIVLVVLAVGGAVGWKAYKFRQGPEFALEKLLEAVNTKQTAALSGMVDFRGLAQDFASNIYTVRPDTPRSDPHPDTAVFQLSREIQQKLLTCLTADPKDPKNGAAVKSDVYAPIIPLPDDFFQQMANSLTLRMHEENIAVLQAIIRHPRAPRSISLLLLMEKRAKGWCVARVINAKELVKYFLELEAYVQQQRDQALAERNRLEQQRMNAQLGIHSCTASVYVLSDKRTAMVVITVMGLNKGPQSIHNMNMIVMMDESSGQNERRLNMAQKINPGENFTYTWRMDFDVDSPEYQALAADSSLMCSARPAAMTFGNGQMLYLRADTKKP